MVRLVGWDRGWSRAMVALRSTLLAPVWLALIWLVPAVLVAAGLGSARAAAQPGAAQADLPPMIERAGPTSPERRAALMHQLGEHLKVLEAQSAVLKAVAKLVGPAVVHIEADVSASAGLQFRQGPEIEEAGSGVVIQRRGRYYVLTNRHVVRGAAPGEIKIHLADGRVIHPVQVWSDPETDIAVMAVSASGLVAAELGDSRRVEIGDFVLAVGSPFGLSHSVTFGIISAKGRRDLRLDGNQIRFQDFLQTDAAINPGNSGGPLVDLRGEVIGINTAIASNSGGNEGIGFAIPINMFMIVAEQLIEHGKVYRAFLGVSLNSRFDAESAVAAGLPGLMGTQVTAVTRDSPAEKAGLRPGDVILQFGEVVVEDDSHLVNLVSLTAVGTRVPLMVLRGGKTLRIEVEVADRSRFRVE